MKSTKLLVLAGLTMALTTGLVACGNADKGNDNEFTISKRYTDDNVSEIPADAVNQVMFAYSTEAVDVTFNTKLTLDREGSKYVLYKQIVTPETKDEEGNAFQVVNAQYEFKGSFEGSGNDLTLKIPTEARYDCHYPTVLNYQSVEKQTQGWVDVSQAPFILTRFNKWYPAKNLGTLDQPVTLSGKTLTFGEVKFEEPEQPTSSEPEQSSSEPEAKTPKITVQSDDSSSTLKFFEDKTYTWERQAGANLLTESGDWKFNEDHTMTLSITQDGELKGSVGSTINAENNLVIEYTPIVTGGSYASMLKATFTMAPTQFGQLLIIQ